MTPFVAAFSNSALVLVRLGQLLEQDWISDGYKSITVNESVRQGIMSTMWSPSAILSPTARSLQGSHSASEAHG